MGSLNKSVRRTTNYIVVTQTWSSNDWCSGTISGMWSKSRMIWKVAKSLTRLLPLQSLQWGYFLNFLYKSKTRPEVENNINGVPEIRTWSIDRHRYWSLPPLQQRLQVIEERELSMSCVGDGLVTVELSSCSDVIIEDPEPAPDTLYSTTRKPSITSKVSSFSPDWT